MKARYDEELARVYAWKLWDLANGIAGFAIVQSVALMVALGANETFRFAVATELGIALMVLCSCSIAAGQIVAVRWTYRRAFAAFHSDPAAVETFREAHLGRVAAIVSTSVLVLVCATAVFVRGAPALVPKQNAAPVVCCAETMSKQPAAVGKHSPHQRRSAR